MSQISADIGHTGGAHDAHGHGHPAELAHHFDTMGQQFSSGKLGMWLFRGTEVLFFGGLFVFYSVWRSNHPEIFADGSTRLDWKLGAINTVILIVSSMTMAVGVTMAQLGKRTPLLILLFLTFLGGAGFMGIKYIEYSHKIHSGLVWGKAFDPSKEHHESADGSEAHRADEHEGEGGAAHEGAAHDEPEHEENAGAVHDEVSQVEATDSGAEHAEDLGADDSGDPGAQSDHSEGAPVEIFRSTIKPAAAGPRGMSLAAIRSPDPEGERLPELTEDVATYFSIYFCLTGLHGIHVLVGMGIMVWLFLKALNGRFGPHYFTPVDLGGLYWHLVDLIWIFLFPLLYLI